MKKKYVLSEQALDILSTPKGKNILMSFFEVKDRRTIENYLANNVPHSLLMNIHTPDLVRILAPEMTDRMIFRKLTAEEIRKMNSSFLAPLLKHNKNEKD